MPQKTPEVGKMASAEFQKGLELLTKFSDQLKAVLDKDTKEEIKEALEPIKHPILGAAFQIKVGQGEGKEELLPPLLKLCAQIRKLSDTETLKNSIKELLSALEKVNQSAEQS